MKVSELSVISPLKRYPYRDTYPWLNRAHDAFGPARLLWRTGLPRVTRVHNNRPTLEQELALIREELPFFAADERAMILGRNAARLWKFTA